MFLARCGSSRMRCAEGTGIELHVINFFSFFHEVSGTEILVELFSQAF